mmetsp:Transcript_76428/g.200516  ORF Transcript_76428/g.200516 Transcript_76428/m.200516 type:complete len:218 (+) Transcript_76428:337-990(+)
MHLRIAARHRTCTSSFEHHRISGHRHALAVSGEVVLGAARLALQLQGSRVAPLHLVEDLRVLLLHLGVHVDDLPEVVSVQDHELGMRLGAYRSGANGTGQEYRQLPEPIARLHVADLHALPRDCRFPEHDPEHFVCLLILHGNNLSDAGALRAADRAEGEHHVIVPCLEERERSEDAARDGHRHLVLEGLRQQAHQVRVQAGDGLVLVSLLDVPQDP